MVSGNAGRHRHHYPLGDGGRRLCPHCKRPATRSCADHPEYRSGQLLGRIDGLLKNGDLSAYQRHKLRKLRDQLQGGGTPTP